MDPSRIRLEDDRFGLIGAAFRPGNRAVYAGRLGDDHVWSIGILVGPEDDIQTVEIDDHGAKSSRMLSSGQRFEGLDILAALGTESYIIAGTFTLMGMELSAAGQGTAHDFAEILRAAADDHSWRLPLRVVGHPRDLQLSAQGRDILRETAAALERGGTATTSLAAARRLELSEQALDSIRRRISRTSLQAYRMHGRWYVVLDNLARSRSTPSVVEEAPEETEAPVSTEAVAEPATAEIETQPEMRGAPTEDDLSAFAEPDITEPEAPAAEAPEPEPPAEPSVEYIEEEPQEEAAEPIAAAETGTTESAEPQMEAAAAEPEVTEEYRVAATTASPASQIETEVAESEAEVIEQATEASVEDLAAASVEAVAAAEEEAEAVETPTLEAEQREERESEAVIEPSAEPEADVEPPAEAAPQFEAEPESIEGETNVQEATGLVESEPEALGVETAASIEEPVVAEDLSLIEEMVAEEPPPIVEESIETEISEAEVSEETPESAADLAALETTVDEQPVTSEETRYAPRGEAEEPEMAVAEPGVRAEEPESLLEPEITEPVQSEEALLFAEMVEQASGDEPVATELESDVAEQSDQLIAERISEAPAAEYGEVWPDVSASADESEVVTEEVGAVSEPSDEVIAEGIRSHVPAYADEVGRDELIESAPTPEEQAEPEPAGETESVEADDSLPHAEAGTADAEAPAAEPEQDGGGGPSAASYFADARGETGARQAAPLPAPTDLAMHLRGEVAFLRQQSREKDRQIGVWGEGAKWLQPFVDQIRSLEKQVERLGELQVQRENERISDLISERDALRQRLEALEAKINATQTATNASSEPNRRSWFRRMMGSE